MPGARQMIAVLINFKKGNKNSLERWTDAYRSSKKRNTINYDNNKIKVYDVGIVRSMRGAAE
jgi:hypothetical protein